MRWLAGIYLIAAALFACAHAPAGNGPLGVAGARGPSGEGAGDGLAPERPQPTSRAPPHGRLVSPEGAPLIGWTVEGYRDAELRELVRVETDALGDFAFAGTGRVDALVAYAPEGAPRTPRSVDPPSLPAHTPDGLCRLEPGEIVTIEVRDERGRVLDDVTYRIDLPGGRWAASGSHVSGAHLVAPGLRADERVSLHVEKPGYEPLDIADVPAGTARMRLVMKREGGK